MRYRYPARGVTNTPRKRINLIIKKKLENQFGDRKIK